MSVAAGPDINEQGLVLYLDASNPQSYIGSGTTWNDLSGNNNIGTLTNGPTFNADSGGSINFDGVNDNVDLPNTPFRINDNITIETIVNPSISQISRIFFSQLVQISGQVNGYALGISDTTSNVIKWYNANSTSNHTLETTVTIPNNSWSHVVSTFQGGVKNIYINGILSVTGTTAVPITTTNTLCALGYLKTTNAQFFNGKMANVKVYNRVLPAQEILQNFNTTRSRFGI